jgi:predicted transcriptional regulator
VSCLFLTNHARVLACVAREPGIRLRDLAAQLDLTERGAHRILCELIETGYLTKHRIGRRNFYEVHPELPLDDPVAPDRAVGDLIDLLLPPRERASA